MTRPDREDTQPRGVLPQEGRHDLRRETRVDPEDVLDRLQVIDIYAWKRAGVNEPGIEHLGPAAEAFHELFGVGPAADRIAAGDADGVALAAIQGLVDRLDERGARIQRLERRVERQRGRIEEQRHDIESLRERLESLQTDHR